MNPNDLNQLPLRDIHLPEAVAWWPLAWGWWLLLALVVLVAVAAVWSYRSRIRQRAAIRGLRAVAQSLANGGSPIDCIQQISVIVRRYVMSTFTGQAVAGMTGDAWLRFLDSRWARDEFSAGIGRVLVFGPYAPPNRVDSNDVAALNELCVDWLRAQPRRPQ